MRLCVDLRWKLKQADRTVESWSIMIVLTLGRDVGGGHKRWWHPCSAQDPAPVQSRTVCAWCPHLHQPPPDITLSHIVPATIQIQSYNTGQCLIVNASLAVDI